MRVPGCGCLGILMVVMGTPELADRVGRTSINPSQRRNPCSLLNVLAQEEMSI